MRPSSRTLTMLCTGTLLCGCAPSTRPVELAQPVQSDCSFRSPTTCWVATSRPRPIPPKPATRSPGELQGQPPAVLAAAADSISPMPRNDRETTR